MSWETLRKNLYNHKICDCTLRRFSLNMCLNQGVVKIKMGLMAKPDGISQGSHIYTIYWIPFFTLPFSFHLRSLYLRIFLIFHSPFYHIYFTFYIEVKALSNTPPSMLHKKNMVSHLFKNNFFLDWGLIFFLTY